MSIQAQLSGHAQGESHLAVAGTQAQRAHEDHEAVMATLGPVDAQSGSHLSHRGRAASVFVGRDQEMAEVLVGLEDAAAGRGRLFLLAGEPGIGKSRLADEVAATARERGARVAWGRCWEAGGAPAYWPWVQVVRACLRSQGSTALSEDLRQRLRALR